MSNELATRNEGALMQASAGGDVFKLADVLFKSGYFSDVKSASQAVVKVLRGQELGIGPIASMENIYVVQGKTALSYPLIGAQIKKSGRYDYRLIEETDTSCEIAFFEQGKEVGRSKFTMADAEAAGLASGAMWKKYRSTMLFARAMSAGARKFASEVFNGAIYTPEELRDIKDTPEMETLPQAPEPRDSEQPKGPRKVSRSELIDRYQEIAMDAAQQGIPDDEIPDFDEDWTNEQLISSGRNLASLLQAPQESLPV